MLIYIYIYVPTCIMTQRQKCKKDRPRVHRPPFGQMPLNIRMVKHLYPKRCGTYLFDGPLDGPQPWTAESGRNALVNIFMAWAARPTGSFGWCCGNHGWPGTMFQGAWCSWWVSPLTSVHCAVYPQRHLTSTHRALVPISEARYISQPLLACLVQELDLVMQGVYSGGCK